MDFFWERAIEKNFEALESIVLQLFALAGVNSLRPVVDTLPRYLRIRILSILRPAEFAARRLIVMAACKLPLDIGPFRPSAATDPSSPPRGEDTKACERSESQPSASLPSLPLSRRTSRRTSWSMPARSACASRPCATRWPISTLMPGGSLAGVPAAPPDRAGLSG